MTLLQPGTDNKVLHELRDELKHLNETLSRANKTNTALTIVLLMVSILQLVVIGFQLGIGLYGASTKGFIFGLVLEVVALAVVGYVIIKVAPRHSSH